jgi:hypothetical protein
MKDTILIRDMAQFKSKDLKSFEKDALRFGKDGKRAIRNAHRAALDMINAEARQQYARLSYGKTGNSKGSRKGRGGKVTFKKNDKDKKIQGFRAGITKKGSWSIRTEFKARGVETRSWINDKQYFNFLAPSIEWGWIPGRRSKYKASKKIEGREIRYSIAKAMRDRVVDAMATAVTAQMAQGKTMTPKELANVIR